MSKYTTVILDEENLEMLYRILDETKQLCTDVERTEVDTQITVLNTAELHDDAQYFLTLLPERESND